MSNYKIVKSRYDNDFALISEIVDAELTVKQLKNFIGKRQFRFDYSILFPAICNGKTLIYRYYE